MKPIKLANGSIVQSGLAQSRRTKATSGLNPQLRPFRAIVINSRTIGDPACVRNLSVEVDLLLVRTQIMIQNVPVAQRGHGVNNAHGLWIPKGTKRTLNDTELNIRGQLSRRGAQNPVPPTPFDQLDGDMVLLDFIEGDIAWPIVTHALTHERTKRLIREGEGWREGEGDAKRGTAYMQEYYLHHYGCELRVNERGDFLLDTVGAYTDPATEDATVASGQVRIRVKSSERFTIAFGDDEDVLEVYKDGDQIRIDLGEGASQRLVLGDRFKTLFNTHTHPTGMGPSGVPAEQMTDSHLSDIAKTS